jgi:hypothetical protein
MVLLFSASPNAQRTKLPVLHWWFLCGAAEALCTLSHTIFLSLLCFKRRYAAIMGCGPAQYCGKGCGNGSRVGPYYFGPRPNPVRPAIAPPTFTSHNEKVRYPPFVYNEPLRSTATQFWRNPGNGPSPQYVRPHHIVHQNYQQANTQRALAQPFPYAVERTLPCNCAALHK